MFLRQNFNEWETCVKEMIKESISSSVNKHAHILQYFMQIQFFLVL
jgi:hypothetical protein